MIVSYMVGERDSETAMAFKDDLRTRITERPQISTDGLKAHREAVDEAFGGAVDFAQIIKTYGKAEGSTTSDATAPLPAPASRRWWYGDRRTWTRPTRHT